MERGERSAAGSTFAKRERLCLKKSIEALFAGRRGQALSAWPLRAVWRVVPADAAPVQILVSVSKRRFKRAADRNRAKRLVREAYRLNKALLTGPMARHGAGRTVHVAFVWTGNELPAYALVEARMRSLLHRMADKISATP